LPVGEAGAARLQGDPVAVPCRGRGEPLEQGACHGSLRSSVSAPPARAARAGTAPPAGPSGARSTGPSATGRDRSRPAGGPAPARSEEHTSELQSRENL